MIRCVAVLAPVALWLCGLATLPSPRPEPQQSEPPRLEPQRPEPSRASPKVARADVEEYVSGNNEFAVKLYAQLQPKGGNLFFSPYGLTTALAIPYSASRGDTTTQIRRAVGFRPAPDRVGRVYKALAADLSAESRDDAYDLRTATGLWTQTPFAIDKARSEQLRGEFRVHIGSLDFAGAPSEAARGVNEWVAAETRDKIRAVVTADSVADTQCLLVSSVYLRAAWVSPFEKEFTSAATFRLATGRTVEASFMKQTEDFDYLEEENLQAVSLPYRGGLRMVVLLPARPDGLPALERKFTSANLARWLSGMKGRQVDLSIPRVRVAAATALNDPLSSLGMPLAFTDRADFSGLAGTSPLRLGQVVHRAWVEMSEAGTDAAAATAAGLEPSWMGPAKKQAVFRADHPFMFLIQDVKTGVILFVGRVSDPS